MEKNRMSYLKIAVFFVLLTSCSTLKPEANGPEFVVCPVCKMKVSIFEGYQVQYNGNTYYFDMVECKNVFKMNPSRFDMKAVKKEKGVL